ncbi:MAG: hypothetical protein C4518_02465 [Desulfobacteraceae bacterium]|nr:MAG: hypothetical protein C4518_02465 [Desulfobacteraceae bacterium]
MTNQLCIYCGGKEATTRDHVPPKSFFAKPRPSNLITVPSCNDCNCEYGKDDERIRNLIISIDTTEIHPMVKGKIDKKRDRSFRRKEGRSNLGHFINSIRMVKRYTENGEYLDLFPAFDLDQSIIDRFLERMVRALLYKENGMEYIDLDLKWKMAPSEKDLASMPDEQKAFIFSRPVKEIGDGIFAYVGYFIKGKTNSLWILNFFEGIEFMVWVKGV